MEPKILCGSKVIRTPKSSSHEVIGSLGTTIILQLMYFETKVQKTSDLYQKKQQIPLCALHTATYLVPSPTAPRQGCNKSQQQVPGKLWTTRLKNMRKSNWIHLPMVENKTCLKTPPRWTLSRFLLCLSQVDNGWNGTIDLINNNQRIQGFLLNYFVAIFFGDVFDMFLILWPSHSS